MGVYAMKSYFHIKSNQGFTLIEIIASIAIFGMLIAIMLPIFPQIMNWTTKSSESLVATNLLDQVAYDLRHLDRIAPSNIENMNLEYTIDDTVYIPKITVSQTSKERELGLFRTHIEIYQSIDGKRLSDTYIYLSGKEN